MKCPFCTGENASKNIRAFNTEKVYEHLIVVQNKHGENHVHAPFSNQNVLKDLINSVIEEANKNGLNIGFVEDKSPQIIWSKS